MMSIGKCLTLPIDPSDIGRSYEAIIRVNSQSGKAGAAYLLEVDHHVRLPRAMEVEFSTYVQNTADKEGIEITSQKIWDIFNDSYLDVEGRFSLVSFESQPVARNAEQTRIEAEILCDGTSHMISHIGNGPISAFVSGVRDAFDLKFNLADFGQNTRSSSSQAEAAAYVELRVPDENGTSVFGAGVDTSITLAPIKAVISALNRM